MLELNDIHVICEKEKRRIGALHLTRNIDNEMEVINNIKNGLIELYIWKLDRMAKEVQNEKTNR